MRPTRTRSRRRTGRRPPGRDSPGTRTVIRSRSAGSVPASSRSIIGSVIGSSLRKRPNSLASSALVPTMSGTRWALPSRIASTGSGGRYSLPQVGPTAKAPSISRWPATINRVERRRPTPPGEPPSRLVRRPPGPAPSSSANFVAYSAAISGAADHSCGRALRNRLGEKSFGGGHGQQCGDGVRSRTLAEDRHVVGVAAEDGDVLAHPGKRHHEVAQVQVVVEGVLAVGQRRKVKTSQRARADSSPTRRHSPGAPTPRRRRSGSPNCP